jgi:DNA-binding NarL/FixJ family response regulator
MVNQVDTIELLIVDDHELVRLGLRTLFDGTTDLHVVGEAGTVEAAVAEALRLRPHVVLMDLRLPGGSGVQACRDILAELPSTHVLFLTSYSDQDSMLAATFAGARGYLLKEIGSDALLDAIRRTATGQLLMDPAVNYQVLAWMKAFADGKSGAIDGLSPQEQRVVALVADGRTNKEIAATLDLSPKTVRNYLSNAFDKLRVSRRSEIVMRFSSRSSPE